MIRRLLATAALSERTIFSCSSRRILECRILATVVRMSCRLWGKNSAQ
ncbi:hypothetical protein HUT10_15315 [Amycolatopsis sp. Hca4]|nr:hypothetical protein HUT10_15315 [Amycolatopsis sp. Hca4]